ncbi:MAG: Ku protein [Terracidiphilus sp.]
MARPFWSGQIRISLVSFGIKLFPAVEAKSEIRFHQISRTSGERIRHQKVSESDAEPVENAEIVKGYEYSKGRYIQIEPEEVQHLRIASRDAIEIEQFVEMSELDPALFVKPYFVVPENDAQAQAFAVIHEALRLTGKVGLGKFASGGREHLMALAPPSDKKLPGMMAYTLRYAEELRSAAEYFAGIKRAAVEADQLALAGELIKRKTAKFKVAAFQDEYEAALRKLVDAKLKHVPLPEEKKPARGAKVIDLMDALRRSVKSPAEKKPPARVSGSEAKQGRERHGMKLVHFGAKAAHTRRKSA